MLKTSHLHRPAIVLIDFGFLQTAAADNTMVCGTPGYIPPEVWETGKRFPSDDVFAMGVVVMQLLLDKVPPHHNPPYCNVLPGGIFTEGASTFEDAFEVSRIREPPFEMMPVELSGLTSLTRKLLDKKMVSRPRALQVLRDPWFASSSDRPITQSSDASFDYGLSSALAAIQHLTTGLPALLIAPIAD